MQIHKIFILTDNSERISFMLLEIRTCKKTQHLVDVNNLWANADLQTRHCTLLRIIEHMLPSISAWVPILRALIETRKYYFLCCVTS